MNQPKQETLNSWLVCVFVVMEWKQEREYKEALDSFNEKNREKVQLITKLMEVSSRFSSNLLTLCFGFFIAYYT